MSTEKLNELEHMHDGDIVDCEYETPVDVSFTLTRNTPENRSELRYGNAYWVEYFDVLTGESRAGIGIVGVDGEFWYPAFKIRIPAKLDPEDGENGVLGWFLVKSWKPPISLKNHPVLEMFKKDK